MESWRAREQVRVLFEFQYEALERGLDEGSSRAGENQSLFYGSKWQDLQISWMCRIRTE